jgi:hypothetical protein
MNFRSFIRRWLVCGLCSGTGHAHNPHLAPAQAIGALVASLGDRADFMATPGKLAILVLAYEELREHGWRGDAVPRQSAPSHAPVLDAVFSGTGSWVVPQPIPNWEARCSGIAA